MKFLTYLIPAAAVIAPALALSDCSESCIPKAVSSSQCDASNTECVCDSAYFLESIFECSTECGADEDAAIDSAEAYCGALYKRSDEGSLEARSDGSHRLALRQQMTVIHKIRAQIKSTYGRAARMALFRKLRRARGLLNRLWGDGKKHKGFGRKTPPRPAHPQPYPPKPTTTEPSYPTQTVIPDDGPHPGPYRPPQYGHSSGGNHGGNHGGSGNNNGGGSSNNGGSHPPTWGGNSDNGGNGPPSYGGSNGGWWNWWGRGH